MNRYLRSMLCLAPAFLLLLPVSTSGQSAPEKPKATQQKKKPGKKVKATLSATPPPPKSTEAPPIGSAPPLPVGPLVSAEKPPASPTKPADVPKKPQ